MLSCPECGSVSLYKDGLRYLTNGKTVQRMLCRNCGYRFSLNRLGESKEKVNVGFQGSSEFPNSVFDPSNVQPVNLLPRKKRPNDLSFMLSKNVRSHDPESTVGKSINIFVPNGRERRVCVSKRGAKNLVKVAPYVQENGAGANQQPTTAYMKAELVDYSWFLKKEGYKESTIISRIRRLRRLIKLGANLHDPESVKEVISKQATWSPGFKEAVVDAYGSFLRMCGIA